MKVNKKKWSIAILLCLTMIAAGCSSNSGNSGNEGTNNVNNPSNSEAPAQNEAPITITFAGSTWDTPTNDGNEVQKYLEEKFNVEIVNLRVTDENFKVKIAAGEIPDVFPQQVGEADMNNFIRQGIIASIPVDEIRQYMPKYSANVDAIDPNAWNVGIIDGQNYGVPRVWLNGVYGFVPTYNKNWLTAIGYSEPPKTIEEFEDVMTKFRNNDPDQNGQKDTYGLSMRGQGTQAFNSVFASFGVNGWHFKVGADGKLTWGGITDEAKEALKLLNKWYKADLIDPEFLTDNNDQYLAKWNNQKLGYKDAYMYHHLFTAITADKENNIEAAYGKGLIGAAGKAYQMSNGALQVPLLFGKDVGTDEKKRIKILQILEELATNDEVYLKTAFGDEGTTYDMVDGVPVVKPPYDTQDKKNEFGFGGFYNPLIERAESTWKFHFTPDKLAFREEVNGGNEMISDALGPIVLEAKSKYWVTLNDMQNEFYTKATIATEDLDEMFEEFKNNWLKSGGQELIDEANKVYEERQAAS